METRPTVGIAGLGRMGHPIAANILEAGFPTVVWNRTQDKAADLLERGATWADNPGASGASRGHRALTSLADPAAVEVGLLRTRRSARSRSLGNDPRRSLDRLSRNGAAHRRGGPERGAAFLDAPVAGSIKAATDGQLGIMVGGDRAAFDRCEDGLLRHRQGGVLPRRER